MLSKAHKQIILWLLTGCTLIAAMVVIGGITRLTGSGLSITEWKVIMGALPPLNQHDWQLVFEKYQQSPQFLKVNYTMGMDEFKAIFWWEYIHRLLGRFIGIVFLIPFIYFLATGKFREKGLTKKLVVLFLLGAFQGFLGWFMVKSGLQDNPHVSHYRLAAHLITAFFVYGFTFWFALGLLYPLKSDQPVISGTKRIRALSLAFFFVLVPQIIYGAFVAGLKAGRIYNTWPKMGQFWVPEGLAAHQPGWINLFENLITIQFIHRSIAIVLVVLAGAIWYASKNRMEPRLRFAVHVLLAAMVLQFILGVFTLLYRVPITLAVLHQAGALVLFTASIFLIHRLR